MDKAIGGLMDNFNVTFYGAGGSSSAGSVHRMKYGTNTSCVMVEAGKQIIILDMGSGLVRLCEDIKKLDNTRMKNIHIFLSHYHYDHIEGFPFYKPPKDSISTIWAEGRNGYSPQALLAGFMHTPYFPVTPDIYNGKVFYRELKENEKITLSNDICIHTMHLNHPGGVTGYRLNFKNKSLVYLLDYEHNEEDAQKVVSFCKYANLVIYDAFFTEQEYDNYKGWGHSTHIKGIELAEKANVEKLVLAHHANWRSDKELDTLGIWAASRFQGAVMAKEGLVIKL